MEKCVNCGLQAIGGNVLSGCHGAATGLHHWEEVEIPDVPTTEAEGLDALRWCMENIGGGFHPDTRGAEYVVGRDGERTFTPGQASEFDAMMEGVVRVVSDPYGVTLDLAHELEQS